MVDALKFWRKKAAFVAVNNFAFLAAFAYNFFGIICCHSLVIGLRFVWLGTAFSNLLKNMLLLLLLK